jgi:phosphatidylserine decarboxylase
MTAVVITLSGPLGNVTMPRNLARIGFLMKDVSTDRAWPFAEGSSATIIFFTVLLATAVALWFRYTNVAAGIYLFTATFFWLLILYFFRDPNRTVVDEPGQVLGPGDGEIVEIVTEMENRYLQEKAIRISMFLNIHDVHVQRVPLGGQVTLIDHQPGKFLQAFKPEASQVNEYIAMITESGYGRILLKQIAGILARRCVNYLQPGMHVTTGQRLGLIKFSSRLDLFLPPTANLQVKVGDKVIGGLTPIACLTPQGHQSHEQ